jgi:hypothetical protein
MDETSICLFQGGARGNVFLSKDEPRAVQNVSIAQRRTYLTHVAFICDDQCIQRVLPQVVIANEHTMSRLEYDALLRDCPSNVRLVRQKSSWNNSSLCAQIMGYLAAALAPFMREFQPLLILDAARLHLNVAVLRACCRGGVWPIVVAASTTWLLQPLDTHVFALFKSRLQKAYQTLRIESAGGVVGMAGLFSAICVAIREVLEGRAWSNAFTRDGFGTSQYGVSERVLEHLGVTVPLVVASTQPTVDQLRLCWPRNARVPVADIWRRQDPTFRATPLHPRGVPIPPRRSARLAAKPVPVAFVASAAASSSSSPSSSVAAVAPIVARDMAASSGASWVRRLRPRVTSVACDDA